MPYTFSDHDDDDDDSTLKYAPPNPAPPAANPNLIRFLAAADLLKKCTEHECHTAYIKQKDMIVRNLRIMASRPDIRKH